MKWLLFYLTITDNIKYITNDMNKYSFMNYKRFLLFIAQFKIIDYQTLINKINRFDTIFFDCETGQWEVKAPKISHELLTHENLMKLNKDKVVLTERIKDQKENETFFTKLWKKSKIDLDKTYKSMNK